MAGALPHCLVATRQPSLEAAMPALPNKLSKETTSKKHMLRSYIERNSRDSCVIAWPL